MFDVYLLIYLLYLLTSLLTYVRVVGLYSHCMCRTLSLCIESGLIAPVDPKLLVWKTKPPEAGEYVPDKNKIRISPKISVIPSGAYPHL